MRTIIHFILSVFCLLIVSIQLIAQVNTIKFDRLSTQHGLSHSIVNAIIQDNEGFMWFGTREGLNKYDGYTFQVFEHDPSDSNSISSSNIRSISKDQAGDLWIGTGKGLNHYHKTTNTFTRYLSNPANPKSLPDNDIQIVYTDKAGTIWIGSRKGLSKFDKKSDCFTNYLYNKNKTIEGKPLDNTVYTIFEDKKGVLWLSTSLGLSTFDRLKGSFTFYNPAPASATPGPVKSTIKVITEDRSGRLWLGTMGEGLQQFDRFNHTYQIYKQDSLRPKSISHNDIFSILADSFGELWVGTRHGLNQFDPVTQTFTHHVYDGREPASISGNSIQCMYEDAFKVLWLGTFKGGLSKYDLLSKKITHIRFDPSATNGLRNDFVYSLYEDRAGNIWIGHGLGIDKLDRDKTHFTYYTYPPTALSRSSLSTAHCLLEDRSGQLWIGLSGEGLKKLDSTHREFTSYQANAADPTSLPHNFVQALHEDRSGNVWIGTRDGLAYFDQAKGTFITYKPDYVENRAYFVYHIIEDPEGLLWIATDTHGLNAFDPKTKQFHKKPFHAYQAYTTESQSIATLHLDRHGVIWACLEAGGLQTFNRKKLTFTPVEEPDLFSKTAFTGILEDQQGNLWLSTRKLGIIKFNSATKKTHIFDRNDGLQGNEFNKAFLKTSSGEMFFGGGNGYNSFHPDSIQDNSYAPIVVLTNFKVFDKPRQLNNYDIELPYSDNFFSFEYAALSYARTEKNQFAFKLENFDQDWIQAGTRRYTSYTNLDPGEYVFKVKAANHDGVWSKEGIAVKITITPPLWKTTWAYLLYGLAGIGLLYGVRQYTLNRERLKNDLKLKSLESARFQELDTLKSQFFANISHEFRTPLTLIMSPLEELISKEKHRKEFQLMYKNAARLLQLINQLLDISKLEAGSVKLESEPGNVIEFIQSQVLSFTAIAQSKSIEVEFSASQEQVWVYFDKDKLEKIISNLLSNAIKFTPENGHIWVKASVNPVSKQGWQHILLVFTDTGIGIPEDRLDKIFDRFYQVDSSFTREFEGTGIGLSLVKQLVDLHTGSISVSSQPGKGSRFIIEIPCREIAADLVKSEPLENELASHPPALNKKELGANYTQIDLGSEKEANEHAPLLLIVEDNADLRSYISKTFDAQYRILEAAHGEEGLSLATSTIPDLIISDLMMPRMDGIKLCKKLKTDERTSHIPVILLTAKATVESKLQGLDKGADDYIVKPFHTEELMLRVRNLIEGRNKLRERLRRELTLQPAIPTDPTPDEKFLQKLMQVCEKNLSNPDFSVEQMEQETDMGHVQLYRKLKALTGQAPGEFLRDFRLKKAAILLSQKKGNVSQIAYEVGFNSLSYFTRSFRQMHGVTPSEYMQDAQKIPES